MKALAKSFHWQFVMVAHFHPVPTDMPRPQIYLFGLAWMETALNSADIAKH